MSPCDHCESRRLRKVRRGLFPVLCALAVLLAALCLDPLVPKWVGKQIPFRDVTAFVYTRASSTNPPEHTRWHLMLQNGTPVLMYEQRTGNHWPLTGEDISASSTVTLTQTQWQTLLHCLQGGQVIRRTENPETGDSGPFMYLYWQGDRDSIRQFTFASHEREQQFLTLCRQYVNPS